MQLAIRANFYKNFYTLALAIGSSFLFPIRGSITSNQVVGNYVNKIAVRKLQGNIG